MFKNAYLCVLAVIFILLPSILTAQEPDTLWTRRYNGPADKTDYAHGCAVDKFGNLYVTGVSYNGTYYDNLTFKYSSAGDTLWSRRYQSEINGAYYANCCTMPLEIPCGPVGIAVLILLLRKPLTVRLIVQAIFM